MPTQTVAKILIVDDESTNAEAVKDMLEDVYYQVSLALSAQEAQIQVKEHLFDLILMDIWMPGTDGITLLKQWQIQGMKIPVVIMSGHGDIQTAVDAMKLGAIDYFSKPLNNLLPNIRNIFARLASNSNTAQNNHHNANYFKFPLKEARNGFERAYFLYHLQENHYNIAKVAQIAQLERTTLYRKLKDLGINK